MDILKALKKQTDDFKKYRRYQARLTKIKLKAPSPENIKPALALVAELGAHLKDMDAHAAEISAYLKTIKTPAKQAPAKLPITN